MNICRTCKWAEWRYGNNRVATSKPGMCRWPQAKLPLLPVCLGYYAATWPPARASIWWDSEQECETWEAK